MRFECNCTNEVEFRKMVEECQKEDCGFNFEVGARLWYTPEGKDFTLMVEYQITTETCRKLLEDNDEPHWFVIYAVCDENDYDCSEEIWCEPADELELADLQDAMLYCAIRVNAIMKEEI